ncbi:unnamed protein product, partial [Brassica rapa]
MYCTQRIFVKRDPLSKKTVNGIDHIWFYSIISTR